MRTLTKTLNYTVFVTFTAAGGPPEPPELFEGTGVCLQTTRKHDELGAFMLGVCSECNDHLWMGFCCTQAGMS